MIERGIYLYYFRLISMLTKKKYRVGFILPNKFALYHRAMASTRYRVYDPILQFVKDSDYLLEIHNSIHTYDILIFQKVFSEKARGLALKAQEKGTRVVLDLNVNYLDRTSTQVDVSQRESVIKFLQIAGAVLTTTKYIADQILEQFPDKKVSIIGESIETYGKRKSRLRFSEDGVIRLCCVSHAHKVKDLLLIKSALHDLADDNKVELLVLTNKDTELDFKHSNISIHFKKYNRVNQKTIYDDLMENDIFISPRDLNETYNLGHSFDRIGRPMSVGIPVIASPIASYEKSPAILINGYGSEWSENILQMLKQEEHYWQVSEKGVAYCEENFSPAVIMKQYRDFFDNIMMQSK